MATQKEESILEKVERELTEFTNKKTASEGLLKEELANAELAYKNAVSEIHLKYNVDELDSEIKRHSYFLKLLKGEIAIPDDLNAKKGKSSATGKRENKNWNEKFAAVYKIVPSNAARKVVIAKVGELYPNVDITSKTGKNQINAALGAYKRANNIK